MKSVKGKYIRITEEQLHRIVKETVQKELEILLEYAIPRGKFVEKVTNLTTQIIENWCLLRFSTLAGISGESRDHWKSELFSHMSNIGDDTIKKNNSYETRLKAIEEGFAEKDLPSTPERVMKLVGRKFIIEKMDMKCQEFQTAVNDCHNAIGTIMDKIANGDFQVIYDYIQTI